MLTPRKYKLSISRRMATLGSRVFSPEPAVRSLIVYNLLQGMYLGYIRIFWQPWMVSLGISIAIIGVLESGAGRNGAISGLMQVVGGRFSDRRGRRRLILAGSGFLIACWLTSAGAFFFGSSALVYLAYLLWGLSLLSLPVIDAMMADYIETPDRSRVYSTMLVANFIPGSITGFLAGEYGASLSPPLLLVLAAGLETVGFALLFVKVRDKGVASVIHRAPVSLRATWECISQFRGFFSIFMMDATAWSLATGILYALLSTRGFTQFEFGVVALTQPIGVVFGTVPGGWLTHRIGARRLLMTSEILGAVMVLGWAFYPVEPLVPLYGIVWGFAISTWVPAQFHLSAAMFPEGRRGEMLGALATSVYFVRFAGPIVAAGLYLTFGYPAPMVAGGLAIFATIILIRRFLPQDD
ncbi:MAG: MFS transporter [Candidatus Bathyarchaeia archaeon]